MPGRWDPRTGFLRTGRDDRVIEMLTDGDGWQSAQVTAWLAVGEPRGRRRCSTPTAGDSARSCRDMYVGPHDPRRRDQRPGSSPVDNSLTQTSVSSLCMYAVPVYPKRQARDIDADCVHTYYEEMRQPPSWSFGDRVRKIRREMGMSQAELADRLAAALDTTVSSSTVSAWELSTKHPADVVATAKALQEITGVAAGWFLGLGD